MNKGWECPRCGTVHAPSVVKCHCFAPPAPNFAPGDVTAPPYIPWPRVVSGSDPNRGGCSACRQSGVCTCVRPRYSPVEPYTGHEWTVSLQGAPLVLG